MKFLQNFLLPSYFECMLRMLFIDFTGILAMQINVKFGTFCKNKIFATIIKKIKKLRLYTIVESFLKGIEPSTIGWSPMLFPWATGTCFVLFIFVGYSGISNWKLKSHDVHTEHLQAKGLFEGSKLAGIFLPFSRRISFIFAGSSWTSFVKVFWSKFRHSSRTRRMTAAIVFGRGERNTHLVQ